ncbi:MAG: Na/Pi symporter, partial [Pseudomonadales bacterium]|nr:Na/Pi symporter [Pseudomonadales bacterium]
LSYMKGSLESLSTQLDISLLTGYPPLVYLLCGLVFTAVIQSSSATMMIALSALNAGMIDLYPAAALIIGADLGTTSTVLLGGIKGTTAKKQVAAAHFLFNLTTTVMAFALLGPLLFFLVDVVGMSDPLYTLVAFHSSFNLLGVILFFPFIKPFANFLEKRFIVIPTKAAQFITAVPARVSEAAMAAMEKETRSLIAQVFALNRRCLKMGIPILTKEAEIKSSPISDQHAKFDEQYGTIKMLEGEMLEYSVSLQKHPQTPEVITRLNNLLSCIRDAVVAAKSLKDIRHNLVEFRHASAKSIQQYNKFMFDFMEHFYRHLNQSWEEENHALLLEQLSKLVVDNNQFHDDFIKRIYTDAKHDIVDERMLSTLLNVNRELYTSNQNLLNAFQHLLLEPQEHEDLSNLYLSR